MNGLDYEVADTENVPTWIEQNITWLDVESIQRGGCASGAYTPAVTYYQAQKTMLEHGNGIFDYIKGAYGELPAVPSDTTWSGIACYYLSIAVETWASGLELPEEE